MNQTEPGSGNPSHEPSYDSGFMESSTFPCITESLFSTRIVIGWSNGIRALGDRDRQIDRSMANSFPSEGSTKEPMGRHVRIPSKFNMALHSVPSGGISTTAPTVL